MNTQRTKWLLPATITAACLLMAACRNDAPVAVSPPPPPAPAESAQAPEVAPPAPTEAVAATPQAPTAPEAPPVPSAPAAPAPAPAPAPRPSTPAVQYAQVISVTPVRQSQDNPKEVCRDVEVVYQAAPKDEHKIAGTAIGAIVGGAIGNQVGDGKGRDAARIAGAVAGAAAGRKIQENQQAKKTETRIEQQCETVNDPTFVTVAYDIVYSYNGQTHNARVAEDPGERIKLPVRSIDE
ncbi:glycine zipper 2TM domain-containing protein [Xanthomonadaceae bacterium XH05]|nr:glycine zipper 2TM domain-containing protein [Xanthomonadaceae bacterium XH05]